MRHLKWLFIIPVLMFTYAVYKSETDRLRSFSQQFNYSKQKQTSPEINIHKKDSSIIFKKGKLPERKFIVNKITGDTLDIKNNKFIMIMANRFSDKSIAYGFSIWNVQNKCSWIPGTLKITILGKDKEILKTTTSKIDKQLLGTCQQLEDYDIYMGNKIYKSYYLNAEFTDINGDKYHQWGVSLGDIEN